jgi:Uma2 family endonuclease
MPTLVKDPAPYEFEQLLERRRTLGQDRLDEVWEGVYHMNPSPHPRHGQIGQQLAELLGPAARNAGLIPVINTFNLGDTSQDYRVPDGGLFRAVPDQVFMPTAALVVEIVSPDDETWEKLDFYAAHSVDELLVVDPQKRDVRWLALQPSREYQPIARSALIALGPDELAERIDWPQ